MFKVYKRLCQDFVIGWNDRLSKKNWIALVFLLIYAPCVFLLILPLLYVVGIIVGLLTCVQEKQSPHAIAMELVTSVC